MEPITAFLTYVWEMETNTGLGKWIAGNSLLLGMFFLVCNGIARSTPWAWDNILVKSFRNAVKFAKPDFQDPIKEDEDAKV